MARWITQTLSVNARAQIIMERNCVIIGDINQGSALFMPETGDEARAQALALRLAAKRLEEMGKGLQ